MLRGVQDGAQTLYHKNGSKRLESHYVKGKLHGTSIWYYENGNKMEEAPSVDGNAHGMVNTVRTDRSLWKLRIWTANGMVW